MRIAIIGRSQLLYDTAKLLHDAGYNIALIVTAKEAPEYTKTSKDFEKFANEVNAVYIYTPKINLEEYVVQIKALGVIELAVSINYTGVISQEVIDIFPLGILNAHAGDLPRYRGNAPLAWAIINGEKRAGLCIHKMIGSELDSGNILAKDYSDINENTRVFDLFNWIENKIPELIFSAINKLKEDPKFIGEQQSKDHKDALRCYPRLPEDGKIDWHETNINVLRLINASSEPFSGSFCYYKNLQLKVWKAELVHSNEKFLAVPGQVCKINSDKSIDVATGNGMIRILEIEYENQRTVPTHLIKSIRSRFE